MIASAMRYAGVALLAASILLLSGCGGGGETATETVTVTEPTPPESTTETTQSSETSEPTPDPKGLVAQLSDMPTGFRIDDEQSGPTSLEDTLEGASPEQQEVIRRERVEGYGVWFTTPNGVEQTNCTATTYRSTDGAEEVLHIGFDRFAKGFASGELKGGQASIEEKIGSETRAYTIEQDGVSTFVVVWNYRNVNGVCISAGFLSTDPDETVRIAQAQQARIEAALGGKAVSSGQPSPPPPPQASEVGTRTNPHPVRRKVALPDSNGWKLRVNGSIPNATKAVMAENQFNDPPKPGRQFFIVNLTMAYSGTGSSTALEAGSLKAVGKSDVAYSDFEDSCGVIPSEFDSFKKVFSGGTITGNVCFAVKKSDVRSLLLFYEPSFSIDDTEVFFAVR
jgi:hypothetical protein